jgi:hypothetical protein
MHLVQLLACNVQMANTHVNVHCIRQCQDTQGTAHKVQRISRRTFAEELLMASVPTTGTCCMAQTESPPSGCQCSKQTCTDNNMLAQGTSMLVIC